MLFVYISFHIKATENAFRRIGSIYFFGLTQPYDCALFANSNNGENLSLKWAVLLSWLCVDSYAENCIAVGIPAKQLHSEADFLKNLDYGYWNPSTACIAIDPGDIAAAIWRAHLSIQIATLDHLRVGQCRV